MVVEVGCALHRKPRKFPAKIATTGPTHNFDMVDAELLVLNQPASVSFELLPTSYLFLREHRIRLSIGAADIYHFSQIPDGKLPKITYLWNSERATLLFDP